jgi:cystathionine beta-synthase
MGTVRDLLRTGDRGKVATASPTSRVRDVIATLKDFGISQLPVVDGGKLKGMVAEVDLLRHLVSGDHTLESPIAGLVESDYATVSLDTKVELLQVVLADAKVAIVTEREEVVGIVTKIDLIDFLAKRAGAAVAPSGPPAPEV